MLSPPGLMLQQTEALAQKIRLGRTEGCQYGEFIRDNVFGVVNNTFPFFVERVGHQALVQLVEDFLLQHCAMEPEFHHIATEFVQFIQHGTWVNQLDLMVLEYEWIAFSAEIDQTRINIESCSDIVYQNPEQYTLSCNPTLHLVELPFEVSSHSIQITDSTPPNYYAVFRNAQHHVVSQKLRPIDVALIQTLQPSYCSSLQTFQQQTEAQLADFDVHLWIQHFTHLGLLNINTLGE